MSLQLISCGVKLSNDGSSVVSSEEQSTDESSINSSNNDDSHSEPSILTDEKLGR